MTSSTFTHIGLMEWAEKFWHNPKVSHMYDTKFKDWQSKYDPARQPSRYEPKPNLPLVSSLPEGKWVALHKNGPRPDNYRGIEEDIIPWIKEQRLKLQGRYLVNMCDDHKNPIKAEVFLFKKVSDALMFKLAWG